MAGPIIIITLAVENVLRVVCSEYLKCKKAGSVWEEIFLLFFFVELPKNFIGTIKYSALPQR